MNTSTGEITITNASSTPCVVTATRAAGGSYVAQTSASYNVTLVKANQATLTVTGPASITYGNTGMITYMGGSGTGAMSYSATGSTGCTVNASTGVITVSNASGTCAVTATKAADTNYNATTSASYTVTLVKANQATLTVTGPSSLTYGSTRTITSSGGSSTGAVTYSAGASTGCLIAGTTLSVTNASGTCNITATRAADNNYNATTSASYTVTLVKNTPNVTLSVTNSPVTYDAASHAATVTISTSSVPGALSNILTGGAASQINAGTYPVTATFTPTDTNNYNTLTGESAAPSSSARAVALSGTRIYDGTALVAAGILRSTTTSMAGISRCPAAASWRARMSGRRRSLRDGQRRFASITTPGIRASIRSQHSP